MSTATIIWTLPEERFEHACAVRACRLYDGLRDIDLHLRDLLKHGGIAAYTAERLAEDIRAQIAEDLAGIEE